MIIFDKRRWTTTIRWSSQPSVIVDSIILLFNNMSSPIIGLTYMPEEKDIMSSLAKAYLLLYESSV